MKDTKVLDKQEFLNKMQEDQRNKEETEVTVTLDSKEDVKAAADTGKISKSEAFKQLYKAGMKVGQIAKFMGSHYSFVYGVISNTFGSVAKKDQGPSKSDKIRELAAEGKTPGEIAKQLNSNYSFVHSVVKKYRLEQEKAKAREIIDGK